MNRTILGIGLASLCSDAGHEMATVSLPLFLGSLGASAGTLGLIEGLADLASSFAKLIAGWYSDRLHRRKPLASIGYFVTASGMASFALATSWWHVLIGRVIGWAGRGARSPIRNVLLSEATTPETYGRAFGFERAMDSLGAVVGPAIGFLLLYFLDVRQLFLATLIPGLAAAFCILFLVSEKPHDPSTSHPATLADSHLPSSFRKFLFGVGLAGLGDFSNTLLIFFATQAFEPLYGLAKASQIAMIYYIGYNLVYTATCYIAGTVADRFPKRLVLAWGYIIAILPALALIAPGSPWWRFAVVFGFTGLYMGIWETVESASAAELLPRQVRGWGFGVLATVNGIGDFVSSAVVGLMWSWSPHAAICWVVATTLAGAAIIARTPTPPKPSCQTDNPALQNG